MRPILFYNNWCPFCRWCASLIARFDKEIAILSFYDTKASILFNAFNIGMKERYGTWWLYDAGGMWPGNDGGWIALLCAMYRTRRLGRVLWRLKFNRFFNGLDNIISWARTFLAKWFDAPPTRRYE